MEDQTPNLQPLEPVPSTPAPQELKLPTVVPVPPAAPLLPAIDLSAAAIQPDKTAVLVNILRTINENVVAALRLLDAPGAASATDAPVRTTPLPAAANGALGTIIEGIFDGRGMVGPDGKEYPIPPNYASKSKLVEGDMLKLTVTPTGAFVFKQIGPIERDRKVGSLVHDHDVDEFSVVIGDKKYRVLKASITYFHGADGDEAVILVPKNSPSKWAAVENVIKRQIDPSSF